MASEPEVIHQEIEETRAGLAKKLETLEGEISETVRSARETVEETIESVTGTVQETVESVKRTFDLEYQMQQRPWTLVAGATVAGFLVGAFLLRPRRHYYHPAEQEGWLGGGQGFYPDDRSSRGGVDTRDQASSWSPSSWMPSSFTGRQQGQPREESRPEQRYEPRYEQQHHEDQHRGPGMVQGLMSQFGDEINMVKEVAIGYGIGLLRDMIKDAVPTLGEKIEKVRDSATQKRGGEPVHGRVMGEGHQGQEHQGQGHPGQGQQHQQPGFQSR